MDATEALKNLLSAVEPFRAFRKDPDWHVEKVSNTEFSPGIEAAKLARLEIAVRAATKIVS